MSVIINDLNKINDIFISIEELLHIINEADDAANQDIASWLLHHNILQQTKRLLLIDDCLLIEYSENNKYKLPCPISIIENIARNGRVIEDLSKIGFARKRLLITIRNNGINISTEDIEQAHPFISPNTTNDDFYKNQCIDLINQLNLVKHTGEQIIKEQKTGSLRDTFIRFLTKGDQMYNNKIYALARMNYDLNYLATTNRHQSKTRRITDWVESYGQEYGLDHTKDFHIKALSIFTPLIGEQTTQEILEELEDPSNP